MKRAAQDEEAVVRVPHVLEIVRVQLALVVVPVEVRDIAIAVGVREHVQILRGSHQDHPPPLVRGGVNFIWGF